ncbi:MAG: FtsX-like permease family protein [Candidatus Hodarchaeota archaeon]
MQVIQDKKRKNAGIAVKDFFKDLVYAFRDLKTQKARTAFGILGIMVSIFLVQIVGVLTDSLSFSYLDAAATNSGATDILITGDISGTSTDLLMKQSEVQPILEGLDVIESVNPRLSFIMGARADVKDAPPENEQNRSVTFYGLDVREEHKNGLGWFEYDTTNWTTKSNPDGFRHHPEQMESQKFGDENVDNDYPGEPNRPEYIPDGKCIISTYTAIILNVTVGDVVPLTVGSLGPFDLTVHAVVKPVQKFMFIEVDTLICNLAYAQDLFNQHDKVFYFNLMIKNRQSIYDTRNIPQTIEKMINIAEDVQDAIGMDYMVQMPKLSELEQAEMMNVSMSVAFIFITIIAMMIGAILINSILSTSVEERIREFGIFRVLGGRRSFPFKLIILQGFLYSLLGTGLGMVLGTWATQLLLPLAYDWLQLWSNPIPLIVQPATIVTTLCIGIGVTLVVTALPALRASRVKIVKAINPYRHQKSQWKVKKEGRINSKLITSGIAACAAGGFVFYLIPQIAMTGEIYVVMIAFLGVQLSFLIGLTLISLGFIPGMEKIFVKLMGLFNKKITPIVNTSLYRYRRRNTSTTLMFSMTFAFILFISTTLELMKVSIRYQLEVGYGTPLVVYSTDVRNQVDDYLVSNITKLDGVKRTSAVYTDVFDIASIMLSLQEQGIAELDFGAILGEDRFLPVLSDLIGYYDFEPAVVGIDENYGKVMDHNLMKLTTKAGWSKQQALDSLFDNSSNPNIIIAQSLADSAQFSVGDNLRFSFYNTSGEYRVLKYLENVTVVGISGGMPGFWQFRQARLTSLYGGVMISRDNYIKWMGLSDNSSNAPVSKIFCELKDDPNLDPEDVRSDIQNRWDEEPKEDGKDYQFVAATAKSEVDARMDSLSTVSLIMQSILACTILIALFGLMSSVYSTVLERKREIGVLKALGLKNRQTRDVFVMESMIILLASSLAGAAIGIITSIINQYEQTTLTEVPLEVIIDPANFPWNTIGVSFIASIIVCFVGMVILLRRIEKMDVMEIFRDTL